jgi:hypothetical protein
VVGRPLLDFAGAHEIAVVFEQFFLAGAGHVGELEFGFLGCAAGLAAFQDVLFAGTGGLHHLVVGAGTLVYETVAEMEGGLVNHQCFVVGEELLVAAVGRDEALTVGWRKGRKGLQGRRGTGAVFRLFCRFCPLLRHGSGLLSSGEWLSPPLLILQTVPPVLR